MLQCKAECWFPEPQVQFLDDRGSEIEAKESQRVEDPTGCFTITRTVALKVDTSSTNQEDQLPQSITPAASSTSIHRESDHKSKVKDSQQAVPKHPAPGPKEENLVHTPPHIHQKIQSIVEHIRSLAKPASGSSSPNLPHLSPTIFL
uniref:Butyrophilin subfamily 3 member A2-like Ig-C domain-containing protein n=1 Tax=Nothobranchius pienaari TaxID=704102 RepID=A0A1A8QXT4_9TELE